jgi:hypothetical protein
MTKIPFLSNVIALHDTQDLTNDQISSGNSPIPIFSIDQISGERDCVVVGHNALAYASNAHIEDTSIFTDALIQTAQFEEEIFFEADYREFISAFPFHEAEDILRIGILIVPSIEGIRFQTVTYLRDGGLLHDPYYMFLPIEAIEAARVEEKSDDYSTKIINSMVVEFPGKTPDPKSSFYDKVQKSAPISSIMAVIGISFMAIKVEIELNLENPLPVLQSIDHMPTIIALDI